MMDSQKITKKPNHKKKSIGFPFQLFWHVVQQPDFFGGFFCTVLFSSFFFFLFARELATPRGGSNRIRKSIRLE